MKFFPLLRCYPFSPKNWQHSFCKIDLKEVNRRLEDSGAILKQLLWKVDHPDPLPLGSIGVFFLMLETKNL